MLENLSIAEKVVVARAHLIVTILKLKPNNKFNPRFYKRITGHVVILSQKPGPLLTLLLSDLAKIEDIVHIV